jgi:hypothetical protein
MVDIGRHRLLTRIRTPELIEIVWYILHIVSPLPENCRCVYHNIMSYGTEVGACKS